MVAGGQEQGGVIHEDTMRILRTDDPGNGAEMFLLRCGEPKGEKTLLEHGSIILYETMHEESIDYPNFNLILIFPRA